ncbi:hypothetical protein ACFQT0_19350 [Hymenobacter humi]|uniref:Uncharacterized protein n=1 Tax=Hymenobacter humi TaxID=1411620 RepID=A0ABW2UAL3_9BACT
MIKTVHKLDFGTSVKLREGTEPSGILYRLPNRRVQITLNDDDSVTIHFKRLLSLEEAAEEVKPGEVRMGRVLFNRLKLSMDAFSCMTDFMRFVETTGEKPKKIDRTPITRKIKAG